MHYIIYVLLLRKYHPFSKLGLKYFLRRKTWSVLNQYFIKSWGTIFFNLQMHFTLTWGPNISKELCVVVWCIFNLRFIITVHSIFSIIIVILFKYEWNCRSFHFIDVLSNFCTVPVHQFVDKESLYCCYLNKVRPH